jgi:hypothetical protein
MPKIRTLKAEYFRDEDLAYSLIVKTLGAGLVCCMADDEGRFKASAGAIKGEVFTHDRVTDDEINEALVVLVDTGFIRLYHVGERRFGVISNWRRHQPVPPSRFTPSNLPPEPPQADRKQTAGTRLRSRKQTAGTAQADASSRAGSHTGARAPKGRGREGNEVLRTSHTARGAGAREGPDDLPPEVGARVDMLVEAFEDADGILARQLRGDERPVILGWARLEREGRPVALAEVVQLARHLLAQPTKEGTLPGTLRFIDPTVQTLARAPWAGPNGHVRSPSLADMADAMDAEEAALAAGELAEGDR